MRTKNQETLDRILKFVNKYYQEHHSSPSLVQIIGPEDVVQKMREHVADVMAMYN